MKDRAGRALAWAGRLAKRSRAALALLALGLAAQGAFLLLRGSAGAMDAAARRFSLPVRDAVSALADLVPFSAVELSFTALGLFVLAAAAAAARRQLRGEKVLGRRLLAGAALAVWLWAGVSWLWGVHYYTTPFSRKSGLDPGPVSAEQLAATALYFAAGASEAGRAVERDAAGRFAADTGELLAAGAGSLAGLEGEYPFLAGPARRPKPAVYSFFMSAAGFTGYIFPFTGESTLNTHCPNVFLPVTIAHEQAHQRGVGPEQEANFVGVAACLAHPDSRWQYSGWLFGFVHLYNALCAASPEAAQAVWQTLEPGPLADLAWNNGYWASFDGPVNDAAESAYTAFLQGYGQSLGMDSYGACVDLLVARYCPL